VSGVVMFEAEFRVEELIVWGCHVRSRVQG
jgi:hypothetical protein